MTGFQILVALLFAVLLPTLFQVVKLTLQNKRQHQDVLDELTTIQQELDRQRRTLKRLTAGSRTLEHVEKG